MDNFLGGVAVGISIANKMTDKKLYACLDCGFVSEYNEVKHRIDHMPEVFVGWRLKHECVGCGNEHEIKIVDDNGVERKRVNNVHPHI